MKTKNVIALSAILALAFCLSAAQNAQYFVNLDVTVNGKTVSPPSKITFVLGKHSTQVSVMNGRFEVPNEIALAEKTADVSFSALVGEDEIHFSVDAGVLRHENWSLRLADRRFADQYQSLIHKGESSRSVCVLVFAAKGTEASVLVAPHCRTRVQK